MLRSTVYRQLRCYASKPSRLTNNFVFNSINFVKKVDEAQYKLVTEATVDSKVHQLISHISKDEELLYLLALFQSECHKLGIECQNVAERKSSMKFYLMYYMRLKPIHDSFWEMCDLIGISNHRHRIRANIKDLGMLDPSNFDPKFVSALRTGRYNGIDFRHVETYSNTKPDFKDE